MTGLRILLVEDESTMAELIARMLSRLIEAFPGAGITRIRRLEDARMIASKLGTDVILLDLNLEDALHDETIRQIKEMSLTAPVVIVTGLDMPGLKEQAMSNGASAFIRKMDLHGNLNLIERTIIKAIEVFKVNKREGLSREIEALRKFANKHASET